MKKLGYGPEGDLKQRADYLYWMHWAEVRPSVSCISLLSRNELIKDCRRNTGYRDDSVDDRYRLRTNP